MSVTVDINNIYTDSELNNLRMEEFSYNMMAIMKECKLPGLNMIKKVLLNVKLFDYLVETQDLWKKHENYTFYTAVKYKLIEYKDSKNFPAYKYLKLLKLYCSYNTSNGVCTKCPNHSYICESHKKFDKKLKLVITTNLFY